MKANNNNNFYACSAPIPTLSLSLPTSAISIYPPPPHSFFCCPGYFTRLFLLLCLLQFSFRFVSFAFCCFLLFQATHWHWKHDNDAEFNSRSLCLCLPLSLSLSLLLSLSLALRKSFQYALLAKHLFGASHLICVSIFGNAINNW